jgi:AcrR family transcriptional regulator
VNQQPATLRARRRTETQRAIQEQAVRLFTDRGYDATTVADVAEAAGVSAMTVYRHFPTKEDLVLFDQRNQLAAEQIAALSDAQPLVRRIGTAIVESARMLTSGGPGSNASKQFLLARLRLMITTPALRAKHLDNNYALQQSIVEALLRSDDAAGPDSASDPEKAFEANAAASACLAVMHTALVRWAEEDGRPELPELIAKALTAAFGADVVRPATKA